MSPSEFFEEVLAEGRRLGVAKDNVEVEALEQWARKVDELLQLYCLRMPVPRKRKKEGES